MITAQEALQQLQEGNQRFVAGTRKESDVDIQTQRAELAGGQSPFAIVLGCADSRAPVETIFDQGLGDLFVVRVAGNIATPTQIGSIEFAVENFGTPLIVVLGHSSCGAIKATLGALQNPGGDVSPNLASLVTALQPPVQQVLDSGAAEGDGLVKAAIRANVSAAVDELKGKGSGVLKAFVDRGDLQVVGAEYSLETGVVEFFKS